MRTLRICLIVTILLLPLVGACASRSMGKKHARDILVDLPGDILDKDDVDIESVTAIGPRDALVETRLRTAFKLEKVDGRWVIQEIRVGNREWEKLDSFLAALERVKTDETRKLLETVAVSIDRYREEHNRLPDFSDYVSLTDILHPRYLTPLIRLDAWRRPMKAIRPGADGIRLASAGPDGQHGTGDDIVVVR